MSVTNTSFFSLNNTSQSGSISETAKTMLKARSRFTDYLNADIWPLCRQGFRENMEPDSTKASNELLSEVNEKTIGGIRVLELIPKTFSDPNKVIVYIHGGALTLGSPDFQQQIPAPIAHKTGWRVIAIDYPLAPYSNSSNDPLPAHTACLKVYKELLSEYAPSQIVFLGDSAGGGMAFGVALMARDKKLALPGAIIAYEPWVDLEQKTDSYSNQEVINQTVVLTPLSLQSSRDAAFGKDNTTLFSSPYVSPINGKYNNFPPVAIFTAERDLLRGEGKLLAEKLESEGVNTYYHCGKGLWHGYQEHYDLPESDLCAEFSANFLNREIN